MHLLVAVPCLNEAATIGQVVRSIPRNLPDIGRVTVLVIDDGSSDDTSAQASAAGAEVIRHPRNLGVGAAFQTAIQAALDRRCDVLVNIDGDGQFQAADIGALVAVIVAGEADFVTGSRFSGTEPIEHMSAVKRIGNRLMSRLISTLCGTSFTDVSCGFRAYSREALLHLNLHGRFTYTQETFLDLSYKRLRIREVPIHVTYFKDRQSRVASSIWRYALHTALIIGRVYRDYFPLRFFMILASIFFIPSVILGGIFFGHFFITGYFTDYLFAGFLSGFLFMVSLVFVVVAIVTDMLDRIRVNQERILYILKRQMGPEA